MTCLHCKYFRVPNDGQEWDLNGVCDAASPGQLVFDSIDLDLANVWYLSCGALVVKEYFYCYDHFKEKTK